MIILIEDQYGVFEYDAVGLEDILNDRRLEHMAEIFNSPDTIADDNNQVTKEI